VTQSDTEVLGAPLMRCLVCSASSPYTDIYVCVGVYTYLRVCKCVRMKVPCLLCVQSVH